MNHREELLRAFRIGPEDLHANRMNRLGARQVQRMRRGVWWNLAGVVLLQAGLIAIFLLVARRPFVWFQYALVGALVVALAVLGYAVIRGLRRAIEAGVVRCCAGPVRVTSGGRGWWLTVQGQRYRLPVAFWRVGRGRPYRVYVAPAAKLIVAMEPEGWS